MVKAKLVYFCQECGSESSKWSGQCGDCGAWNSLTEEPVARAKRRSGYAGTVSCKVTPLAEVKLSQQIRFSTQLPELDHVLGGGVVPGSVILIGGDPGIGKSTLLLQTLASLSQTYSTLYISGEESLQQITLRAHRLGLPGENLFLLPETQLEHMLAMADQHKPKIMVIDSIQTMFTELVTAAPGAVSQVRESTALLVRYAKQHDITVFIVGHVTKEGALAGPRVLEHMVDTVLYFEGKQDSRFRVLRAVKNRFGAVNELGVFAMTEKGLRGVNNPSPIFLSQSEKPVPGGAVVVTWEGSRPILVEVQALVDESHLGNPRRVTVGFDQNRLAMLLAILHRHGGVATFNHDVFLNVVGGVKVSETAADLGVIAAVVSSLWDRPLANDLLLFGELGLAGELRPVTSGQERLREAAKLGFKRAIIPKANVPKKGFTELQIHGAESLAEAIGYL